VCYQLFNTVYCCHHSSFNALDGNPFSVFEPEEEDNNDDVDDDNDVVSVGSDKSADDPDIYDLFSEDHHFTNRYCRTSKNRTRACLLDQQL